MYRGDGSILDFTGCGTGFLQPGAAAKELGARLEIWQNGYILHDGDRRYYYSEPSSSSLRYLTAILDQTYNSWRSPLVSISWITGGCGHRIGTATLAGEYPLYFSYDSACRLEQLTGIAHRSYFYDTTPNELQWTAAPSTEAERYVFGNNSWSVNVPQDGALRQHHTFVDGKVTALYDSWDGYNLFLRDSFVSEACPPFTSCESWQFNYQRHASYTGEGLRDAATPHAYSLVAHYDEELRDTRTTSGGPPENEGAWSWASSAVGGQWADTVSTSATGSQSSLTWTSTGMGTPAPERLPLTHTDEYGRVTTYGWTWGDTASQHPGYPPLLSSLSTTSVIDPNLQAITSYRWNTDKNILEAEYRTGLTREYSGGTWQTVTRTIATFYKTQPACTSEPADAWDRVVETHGPCFVQSTSSTDCDVEGTFPVQGTVYGDSQRPNAVTESRVWPKATFASGALSCGTPLISHYSGYDFAGRPSIIQEPDGVTSWVTYAETVGPQIQSIHRAFNTSAETVRSFVYDRDKVTAESSPDGYWKVWCYRTYNTTYGCIQGSRPRTKPTAFVIADNPGGINPSEGIRFSYAPDGTLLEEVYFDGEGDQRTAAHESNYRNENTFAGLGLNNVGGTWRNEFLAGRLHHRVDEFGALTTYDWAHHRLTRATGPAVGSACLRYDEAGNVSDVLTGSDCDREELGQQRAHYTWDDFGNVVSAVVTTPIGQNIEVKMAWDARGNLTLRETPVMRAASASLVASYDGLGRLLSRKRVNAQGSEETLLVQEWDVPSAMPTASWCNVPGVNDNPHRVGRLAYRADATGETWFSWDSNGHLRHEFVRPLGASQCSTSLSRSSLYSADGALQELGYPYGRTVKYLFTAAQRRPTAVSVTVFEPSGPVEKTVIDDIHWEPFGGVRYYRIRVDGPENTAASVDYRAGQTARAQLPHASDTCPLPNTLEPNDQTGLVRHLMVRRASGPEAFSAVRYQHRTGSGSEHVFSKAYSMLRAELPQPGLTREEVSCLLSDPGKMKGRIAETPGGFLRETQSGYDAAFGTQHGAYRAYGGAGTGVPPPAPEPWEENRKLILGISRINPGYPGQHTYLRRDLNFNSLGYTVKFAEPAVPWSTETVHTVDANGQVKTRYGKAPTSFPPMPAPWSEVLASATLAGNTAGLEGVYRGVTTEFGFFEYYYDGQNRRRVKIYPSGAREDYFFKEGGTELLTDVGNDTLNGTGRRPIDDYIWLDGKPVVIIRGRLSNAYARIVDSTGGGCSRNGTHLSLTGVTSGTSCGFFYPVAEPDGRLALLLDDGAKVAGTGEHEPYGAVNQVPLLVSTGSPYRPANETLLSFQHQSWADSEVEVRTRLHFFGVHLRAEDDVTLKGPNHITSAAAKCRQTGRPCDGPLGRVTTDWVLSEGLVPLPVSTTTTTTGRPPVVTDRYGATVDYIEYLRSERGAKSWWPPLRLPGQYFDAETGLHENWNRFYDSSTGTYYAVEPFLQDPTYMRDATQNGIAIPVYSYALNNPLRHIDPTGLDGIVAVYEKALEAAATTSSGGGWVGLLRAVTPVAAVAYFLNSTTVGDGTLKFTPGPAPPYTPGPAPSSEPEPVCDGQGSPNPCPVCPVRKPRFDQVPPSRPHYPCEGNHTHWYVPHQSPPPACKCDYAEYVQCH